MNFISLNEIQLPALVLEELYRNDLVDLQPTANPRAPSPSAGISFLGNNQKRIAVIVDAPDTIYLPDDELNFLLGILSACKLSMADIALINLAKNPSLSYTGISEHTGADKILLFGMSPASLELPLQFPHYQVQHYNNQVYLSSPGLPVIEHDREEKTKLWTSLKQLFSLG